MAKTTPAASGQHAARQAANQLRAKQKATARRRAALAWSGIAVVGALFIGVVAYVIANGAGSGPYGVYDSGTLATPTVADAHGGILMGQDGVVGGDVAADAIKIDIYEDSMCPNCKFFSETTSAEITALREAGLVEVYYHPIAILNRLSSGTQYPVRAAAALATVAEYDGGHYLAFAEALFANQPAENTKGLSNVEIEDVARGAGVSDEVIAKFANGEFTQWVSVATEQASIDGVSGTPTFLVAGVAFSGWLQQGQITAAVTYVHDNGADAFASLLAELAASPSAS